MKPRLADAKNQQSAYERAEDAEFPIERIEVALSERVVKIALPAIEPDLSDRVEDNHGDDQRHE